MSFDKINFLTKEDSKGNKTIPLILLNVLAVLREDDQFKNHFRRNVFSGMVESDFGENSFINLTDVICSRVREKIMIDFPPFYALSALMVREAILTVADDIRVNPPRDWLESLSWDGEYRLENWISHTFQIPNEDRIQEIGRKWMIGLCARVLSPGCQMDEVLVFNGGEGGKKSSVLRILGGEWHVETNVNIRDKDFFLSLAQNILVEFAEGAVVRESTVDLMKAVVTKRIDEFRPPYERGLVRHPRGCVFAVTANNFHIPSDGQGRRWLVVEVPEKNKSQADTEWLQENRDQLFAEAVHRFRNGEQWWNYLDDIRGRDQFYEDYPYSEKIIEFLQRLPDRWTTTKDIFDFLHNSKSVYGDRPIGRKDEMEIGSFLKFRLKLEKRRTQINGVRNNRWYLTDETLALITPQEDAQGENEETPTLDTF